MGFNGNKFKLNAGLAILIIVILIILIFLLGGKSQKYFEVCFNNKETCFKTEIADTEEKRQKGLMFRNSLKENEAMLFIFQKEDIYPFWMKDTLIPLDIIWINNKSKIVFIEKNARPCPDICKTINPNITSSYVLEINSGLTDRFEIKEGNTATISSHNN